MSTCFKLIYRERVSEGSILLDLRSLLFYKIRSGEEVRVLAYSQLIRAHATRESVVPALGTPPPLCFHTAFGQSSSNPFGQSSSSPFGSQPIFGQSSNASNSPYANGPFGSTPASFGSPQTGSPMFGGTSTGVFGATQSPAPAFGASSSPAFGVPSTPTFGSSSPAFGGFGSTPVQSSPFGSTGQSSQPAFGTANFGASSPFGSSTPSPYGAASTPAFGVSSTPAFGASSTPAFGATNTPGFGATSTPGFGATSTPGFGATSTPGFGATSTPGFGATNTPSFGGAGTPAFGSTTTPSFGSSPTSVFGSTGSAFGASTSTPAFGGAFGASSTPAFGASSTPAFGGSSTPAFGSSGSPAFGVSATGFGNSSTPSFSFGSSPAFGQSASAFGSSSFASSSPFGAQIGSQAATPTFGSPGFGQPAFGGQQRIGSRITPYAPTPEPDTSGSQAAGKLLSISAMAEYASKSHEELRWEDYQLGDKGGPNTAGQSVGGNLFAASSSTGQSSLFSSASSSPFSSTTTSNLFSSTTSNLFAPQPSTTGFGSGQSTSLFGSTSLTTTNVFGTSTTPAFGAGTSSSLFNTAGQSSFGTTTPIFNPTQGTTGISPGFTSQSSPLFSSIAPSFAQTNSGFGQPSTPFGQTTASFGQSSTPSLGQTNIFASPSTGFSMSSFSSTPSWATTSAGGFSQTTPSFSSPFQLSQPPQTGSAFGFSNLSQPQPVAGGQNIFGQNNMLKPSANLSTPALQVAPPTNPFGMLPPMPQISIGQAGTGQSIQYGISSIPVVDKRAHVRVSSLLTSRHRSLTRMRMPPRRYHPKVDHSKVPFFSDQEETPSTPKADALIIPRENPRALVIHNENWSSRVKPSPVTNNTYTIPENGKVNGASSINGQRTVDNDKTPAEDGHVGELPRHAKITQKSNGLHEDFAQKGDSHRTLTGNRAGEAAIAYEHGADIEALMPKLRHSEYYTEPRIQELAAKERAEPGFCSHVKDFVVGRHGFGSIKFMGETDVRRLDINALIKFENREVVVYEDNNIMKPPVGQGLNKPAEVTLLNIKCFDRKTGRQYTEGPRLEKYTEMLKNKAAEQGAEFVSYDTLNGGEWKFRVKHFSKYELLDDTNEASEVRGDADI
ncbi:hypothetical protein SAY87_024852 [Trapa incisa]|uniref:Nucleoporin autopeptidase n=1 Tax=Trapa incisa TaxID=236973 RepID=A0AAN7JFD7_9MYRT|nr:hypothetical protein SAY87_024852 [Trapa incisa]